MYEAFGRLVEVGVRCPVCTSERCTIRSVDGFGYTWTCTRGYHNLFQLAKSIIKSFKQVKFVPPAYPEEYIRAHPEEKVPDRYEEFGPVMP